MTESLRIRGNFSGREGAKEVAKGMAFLAEKKACIKSKR